MCCVCLRTAVAQSLVADALPLTPEVQLTKFQVPSGFEIQLVAHEPDIHKPMNMKFDERGRLWITHSVEYPFPAESDEKARDAITILSKFSPDGRAKKVERFADHLNIPIGIVPLSGREALTWSIPNIYRLIDADGDGAADAKSIAFGPFGVVDTHGDQNAFTRWIDGWVYANHGFANDSHVKLGGKGSEVLNMQSGNTYRFKPDGSAIEQYSWGQVNPFGLCFDPLGNLYSADCHSSAVTMLLREGYYQSFGKPHDGLGYAPDVTRIDHGGTGIAGVAYSSLPNFPQAYRDVLFVGNVITNRVHCDRLKWTGSTPVVAKVEDFITCDDPWFRPVDLQLGPDGALYIADFYNCIIGHYEVPLDHPRRDRERGRIWRVVYKGQSKTPAPVVPPMPDLDQLNTEQLFALLGHPNLTVRVLATNLLVDKLPNESAAIASELLSNAAFERTQDGETSRFVDQACHAVWILQRTSGISEQLATKLSADGAPESLLVHLAKALGETTEWQPWHYELMRRMLDDKGPFARRAAAEALAKHPAADNITPLLAALNAADDRDAQLYHQLRIAIRDQLRSSRVADKLLTLDLSDDLRKQLVSFAVTAPTGPAAILVFDEAIQGRISDEALFKAIPVAAKYVDESRVDAMIAYIDQRFPTNQPKRMEAYRALSEGLTGRGKPLTKKLETALTEVIKEALLHDSEVGWFNASLPGDRATPSPWALKDYAKEGGEAHRMISSLPNGERLGGVLTSPAFVIPQQIVFWMCGHNGLPGEPDRKLNYARLVLEDGLEVARSYPPRNDVAQRFTWDLASHAGQRGRIEVVDGLTDLDGFAWIAVSPFEPVVVSLPNHAVGDKTSNRAELLRLIGQLKLAKLTDDVSAITESTNEDLMVRLAALESMSTLDPLRAIAPLDAILNDADVDGPLRELAARQLGQMNRPEAKEALLAALKAAPGSVAVAIAANLAGHQISATSLLEEIQSGKASANLLLEPVVSERLKTSGLSQVDERIAELTADLTPDDNRIAQLIADRRVAYLAKRFDPEVGRGVFAKSVCANCHRIGEVGSQIGPALDGIGNRGLDRLLEDTLDPSRNVDAAFRMSTVLTVDGLALSGFGLREEGEMLVFHDDTGKQTRVPSADVAEQIQSTLSPMPANVIEQMPVDDYLSLLAYLLSLRQD